MLLSYSFTPYIPPFRVLQSFFASYIPPLWGKSARAEYVRGEVFYKLFSYKERFIIIASFWEPPPTPLPEGESRTSKILLKEQNPYFALYNLPFHSYNPCLRPTIPLFEGAGGG